MARPKCLMRDFTKLNRIYEAHRTNVWWIMKVFRLQCKMENGVWLTPFSIPLLPRLLVFPAGHQQLWCWLCSMCRSYQEEGNVPFQCEWISCKMQLYIYLSSKKFSMERVKSTGHCSHSSGSCGWYSWNLHISYIIGHWRGGDILTFLRSA